MPDVLDPEDGETLVASVMVSRELLVEGGDVGVQVTEPHREVEQLLVGRGVSIRGSDPWPAGHSDGIRIQRSG